MLALEMPASAFMQLFLLDIISLILHMHTCKELSLRPELSWETRTTAPFSSSRLHSILEHHLLTTGFCLLVDVLVLSWSHSVSPYRLEMRL